ncbi:MAG TPA: YdeI/OmpD-associated family protein [Longimicrobiales bacterium]
MSSGEIVCTSVVERTSGSAPRFAGISDTQLGNWAVRPTLVVEGSMNGMDLGRTTLRRTDRGRYEIELPSPLCAKAQVNTGDHVTLRLRLVDDVFPVELQQLLDADAIARESWSNLSEPEQRTLREHVASARLPETRARRAREGLVCSAR